MHTETIHTCYQPIAQYWQDIEYVLGHRPTPAFALRGIDIFLIRQIAAYYPTALQVLDLAAQQTLGASSVAWITENTPVARLFTLSEPSESAWQMWLQHYLEQADGALKRLSVQLIEGTSLSELKAAVRHSMFSSCVIAVLPEGLSFDERLAQLKTWLETDPKAIFFILPFGKVGEDSNVHLALQVSDPQTDFAFRLGREISAMFAGSQLGIFYPKDNPHLPQIFSRLQTLYEGNFNFAALLNDNTNLRLRLKHLEEQNAQLDQVISQQSQQIASYQETQQALESRLAAYQETQQALESRLAALLSAPTPVPMVAPPAPLDGLHVPVQLSGTQRLRLRLSRAALALKAKRLARLFYPRRLRAYEAEILTCTVPAVMTIGSAHEGTAVVLNTGKGTWYPPHRTPHCVNVSYHWLNKQRRMLIKEGERTALPRDVMPGERISLPFRIIAPNIPGSYYLQVDLVHEGVRWLGELANFPSYPVEVAAR